VLCPCPYMDTGHSHWTVAGTRWDTVGHGHWVVVSNGLSRWWTRPPHTPATPLTTSGTPPRPGTSPARSGPTTAAAGGVSAPPTSTSGCGAGGTPPAVRQEATEELERERERERLHGDVTAAVAAERHDVLARDQPAGRLRCRGLYLADREQLSLSSADCTQSRHGGVDSTKRVSQSTYVVAVDDQ